jgi:D-3-phosphoglycerate dehydrogenase
MAKPMKMDQFRVLVEARPFSVLDSAPMKKLKASGIRVIDLRGSGIKDHNFIEALNQADAVLCGNDLQVDDDLFTRAPEVKAVAKLGVGLDNVDITAASRHGVVVFHTPVLACRICRRTEHRTFASG